jgi:group II intron reverse transcriptase/maturase
LAPCSEHLNFEIWRLTKTAGRPALVTTPKPYKPQCEGKIANHLNKDESVHDILDNRTKNLRIHQTSLNSFHFIRSKNLMLMQNLHKVGMVKGGCNVKIRKFSSDSKKINSVPISINLDPIRVPKVFLNTPKESKKTKHIPIVKTKGCNESTSNNCEDVAKIVYRNFITIEAIKESFGKLKNKSPGLDDLVKTNWKESTFLKLHKELVDQSYKPKPAKRIYIPKPNGGVRPISIASSKDKVVQGLLKKALEASWEATFLENSHGFRPKRSCHTALKTIRHLWAGTKWFISIDIEKAFDSIHHQTLINILKGNSNYSVPQGTSIDKSTEDLLWKMLRAGYVDIHNLNDRTAYDAEDVSATPLGVPQGSTLSPLLCNIFFHQIDVKLSEAEKEFNIGKERRRNPEWRKLMEGTSLPQGEVEKEVANKYPELKQAIRQAERNQETLNNLPSGVVDDPHYKRLHWVRYADDILLGVIGSREDCNVILNKVTEIISSLSLNVNKEKTFINHAKTNKTAYLGADLIMPSANLIRKKYKNNLKCLYRVALTKIQLYIPIKKIILRLVAKGYAVIRKDGKSYRARRQNKYCTASEYDIVMHFSNIIRGLVNYYSFASQKSDLWKVLHIIKKSCALTLASKFNLSGAASVFKKYGANLEIYKDGKPKAKLYFPTSLKTNHDFKTGYGSSLAGLNENAPLIYLRHTDPMQLKSQCELCGSKQRLELHHIDPVANIAKNLSKLTKAQIARNRECLTLCYVCHRNKMHGHKVL